MAAASFFDIMGPGQQPAEEEGIFPQLTYKERLIGFVACSVLGYLIGGLSILQVFNPVKFAISFTLGNILSLTGTGFLIGFKKQFQNMVEKERRITTIIFFSAMAMVFVSCYALHSKLLVLIFLIVEICAYIWYTASYIPFAQNCIKSCLSKTAKDIGVANV